MRMSSPFRVRGPIRPFVAGLSLLLLAGCSAEDDLPAMAAPAASPTVASLLQSAILAGEVAPTRTVQEINDRNPMGWTGRAHNAYLIASKEALKQAPRTRCDVLDRVLRDGRFLGADTLKFPRAAREQFAPPSVARVGCLLRSTAMEGGAAPTFVRPAAFSAASMAGDPAPYFTAMEAAYALAATAAQYAALVDAIVVSAESVLDGDELIAVQTGASIAISSADYWEANIISDYNEIEYLFETCAFVADEPYQCGNDVSLPGAGFRAPTRFVRASFSGASTAASCSDILSWKGVAKMDGVAGFGALLLTLNPGAGVAAGGTASVTGFLGQGLAFYVCAAMS
jgi:hypothetical protein